MNKQFKKLVGVGTGIALTLSMVACSNDVDTTDVEVQEDTKEQQAVDTVEIQEPVEENELDLSKEPVEIEEDDSYSSVSSSQNTLENETLATLQASYYGTGMVEFYEPEKTFIIIPTDDNFVTVATQYHVYGMYAEEWKYLEDTHMELSRSIMDNLGNGYSIIIVNPQNYERVLLKVMDGRIITTL